MIRMEDSGWAKRRLFHFFLDIAKRVGPAILDRHRVPLARRMLYWLGGVLVYGPLKNTLGFSRIRVAYTAGGAVGGERGTLWGWVGINLKQLYGMTESSVFLCIQRDGAVKPDTAGAPIDGVEIRIAEDGEVLFRSPGAFQCYYKNPEATAAAKRPDGWVHTGDSGFFDADGQLKILDRARDVGRLRGGALFAPKFIENKLKFFPWIKEAVVFGDGRPFVAAFLNIDLEAVGDWAERRNLAYASYQELSAEAAVYDLVRDCIERVNRDLAAEPALAPSQIRRFLILHKELDADDGELTRTRKVRRRIIAERYEPLVAPLYPCDAAGIARTFQNVALFKGMATLDNIMTGRLLQMRRNFLWQAIHIGPAEQEELAHRAHAERIIDFLEIQAIRKTPVGRLPYGLQKRVELGRALAMEPELLLLDEPMAGMNVA